MAVAWTRARVLKYLKFIKFLVDFDSRVDRIFYSWYMERKRKKAVKNGFKVFEVARWQDKMGNSQEKGGAAWAWDGGWASEFLNSKCLLVISVKLRK